MDKQQIDKTIKRGRGYWFVDGFTELLAGGVFILMGGVLLGYGITPRYSSLAQFTSVASEVSLVKIFGVILALLALGWLKNRFTYPRTGFVREKRISVAQALTFIWVALLVLLVIVLSLMAAFLFVPATRTLIFSVPIWLPIGLGVIWSILCMVMGERLGLHRFRVLGVFILLTGIAVGIWQLVVGLPSFPVEALLANPLETLPVVLHAPLIESVNRTITGLGSITLVFGVLLIVSGAVTLLRYRKANPVPYGEEA